MTDSKAKQYWNNRYAAGGNSGYGSYDEQLDKKLKWLSGLDIKYISEIGCGDFNFSNRLTKLYPGVGYIGQDISNVVVERNNSLFPYSFTSDISELPGADLVMCIDVLFHVLDDDEYESLLKSIERKWTKYLAITAYEEVQSAGSHLKVRKFDYKRFGEPIIREIVEEDGQLYFYLFKKPEIIDLSQVSLCLNTKDSVYPQEILNHIKQFNFGEVLIRTNSDSPHCKYELFEKAKFDLIAYQDDDAICPWKELSEKSNSDMINVAMKQHHYETYQDHRLTMGLGWGSIFPKSILGSLKKYTDVYGEDEIYKRETERILTYLNYPQNRLVLPIIDLPSAYAEDRLWRQPRHYDNIEVVEKRCVTLLNSVL